MLAALTQKKLVPHSRGFVCQKKEGGRERRKDSEKEKKDERKKKGKAGKRKRDNKIEVFMLFFLSFCFGYQTPGPFCYNSMTKAVSILYHFAAVITELPPYLKYTQSFRI